MTYDTQIYGGVFGVSNGSKSLAGRSSHLNPIQLYSFSKQLVIQGAPIWAFLKVDPRKWGANTPLRYSKAEAGYSYTWVLSNNTFVVTDDKGSTTTYTGATTIKSLGISWGVLKSTQFYSVFTNFTNSDLFPLCNRYGGGRILYVTQDGNLPINDYLKDIDQHGSFNYLVSMVSFKGNIPGDKPGTGYGDEPEPIIPVVDPIAYKLTEMIATILLSRAENLQATNGFDTDLLSADLIRESPRDETPQESQIQEYDSLLMIAVISSLLLRGSKPVFEPWMLWKAYAWYSGVTHGTANSRQIFDLSPRWG